MLTYGECPCGRTATLTDGRCPKCWIDILTKERGDFRGLVEQVGRLLPGGVCNECRDERCADPATLASSCRGWQARRLLAKYPKRGEG